MCHSGIFRGIIMGRPRFNIDYDEVRKLASYHLEIKYIADFLGCSVSTLEHNQEFKQIYKKEQAKACKSLLMLMWGKATQGNVTMMIWLSKQFLGFKDRIEESGEIGDEKVKPTVIFSIPQGVEIKGDGHGKDSEITLKTNISPN
jgi:hypothetical protein